jgi:lipid II:glycine glycyltransferase (peptidoglycan interpeptide bridge formation enzyme)
MDIDIRPAGLSACDSAETFLQSGFWASFKAGFGWKPLPFILSLPGKREEALLVMERGLGAGMKFAYVPHGPALELAPPSGEAGDDGAARTELLASVAARLKPRLSRESLFLRFDPAWYLAEEATAGDGAEAAGEGENGGLGDPALSDATNTNEIREVGRPSYGKPFRRAAADVQPPDTVLLDLARPEEELLAGMKPKWRYNIRLAEKKGVVVSEARASRKDWRPALSRFYELYRETSERDRIALHPESYYMKLFEIAEGYASEAGRNSPDLRLWTASHEGEALAAIVTIFWGRQAVYLYGASSNEKRNLMPTYALQWAAIRAAREAGCGEYDFYGIPPVDDPAHPMAGLYRFKTGFGGAVVHRGGSWDYPLKPLAYSAFRRAESLRHWYYKDFRKRK